MSKIIEITGPPGSGKSTLYKALIKQWKKNDVWAPRHTFFPDTTQAPFGSAAYLVFYARKFFKSPLFSNAKGYHFLRNNPAFSDFCWKMISKHRANDHQGVDNRFRSAYYLFSVFRNYQGIEDSSKPKICITDEFLVHRIIQIAGDELNMKEIEEYVDLAPLPEAVVFLDAPVATLLKRLELRNKRIIRHRERSSEDLERICALDKERYLRLAECIRKKNKPVLELNTALPLQENVKQLTQFISECNEIL